METGWQEPGQARSRAEPVNVWTLDSIWGAATLQVLGEVSLCVTMEAESMGALPALLAARAWASTVQVHPSSLCLRS